MPIIARDTISYVADGQIYELLLVGVSILDAPLAFELTPSIQRTPIVGASWVDQRARGNAIASLGMCIAIARELPRDAEYAAMSLIMELTTHSTGRLNWYGGYLLGQQSSFRHSWQAAIDKVTYHPIAHDRIYSADASWVAISIQMSLTNPTPL